LVYLITLKDNLNLLSMPFISNVSARSWRGKIFQAVVQRPEATLLAGDPLSLAGFGLLQFVPVLSFKAVAGSKFRASLVIFPNFMVFRLTRLAA
jgi:hypothetical protein